MADVNNVTYTHITYINSTIKKATRQNLVAFHKNLRMVFNASVLDNVDITQGLYATFHPNMSSKCIHIHFSPVRHKNSYKISNPRFNKHNKYLSVSTTDLLFKYHLCLKGAFKYEQNASSITIRL